MDNEKEISVDSPDHGDGNASSPDAISSTSKDFDETYEVYKQQDARASDPQEARRVLRKIDFHIVPLMMGTYMLQYL